MLHAQDSFLKYLQARLQASGITINTNTERPLIPNALNVTFLTATAVGNSNPAVSTMQVSLDILAEGDATAMPARKAKMMALAVDAAISTGWVKKQNWADPANPVDLGTVVSWRAPAIWRNVPEPAERFAHLNKTLSLRYLSEKV